MLGFFKKRRRAKLLAQPFPEGLAETAARNVPYLKLLGDAERSELHDLMRVFLAEKQFVGRGGLEITDEIRITVAAQACLLLLGIPDHDFYPDLVSIIVYPRAYRVPTVTHNPDGTVTEQVQTRLGESWHRGQVVLSWDDVRRGACDPDDARNVVLHEFAHQLDAEVGANDGAPRLPERAMYTAWAQVLGAEYDELHRALERGSKSLIRPYGATNPAEFFAVITEIFFERPAALRAHHPELYEQLRLFYRQDPAARERGEPDRSRDEKYLFSNKKKRAGRKGTLKRGKP